MFGSRHVEEEVREITVALVDVRPLGEDLPERRDAFFRRALVGWTELPLEVLDHPDVLPELRQIRRILTQRSVQSRPFATGVNEIVPGCTKTGVRNVQREAIEMGDNGTDASPSRGRRDGLILLINRRIQRTRGCVAGRAKGSRAVHDLDMTLPTKENLEAAAPSGSKLYTEQKFSQLCFSTLLLQYFFPLR